MIAHPVSRYLVNFGAEEALPVPEQFETVLQPLSSKEEDPFETLEAQIQAAREEGRIEARAAAQALIEAKIAEQKLEYEKRIAQERHSWVEEEGAKFGLSLTSAVTQLQEQIAECVDAVLRPFLIETLRRQMINELISTVSVILASDEVPAIEISGAADLIAILQEKLSTASASISYLPNDKIDVRIVAHHTIIETQLRAWIERFELSKE